MNRQANSIRRTASQVTNLTRELHAEGATICMVTHDPRYPQHAERSVHLFDGRVVDHDEVLAAVR
jgi:putative ABC transport system ATP-binding protein